MSFKVNRPAVHTPRFTAGLMWHPEMGQSRMRRQSARVCIAAFKSHIPLDEGMRTILVDSRVVAEGSSGCARSVEECADTSQEKAVLHLIQQGAGFSRRCAQPATVESV